VEFAKQHENVYASIGVFIHMIRRMDMTFLPLVNEREEGKIVAVGEIGLIIFITL